MAGMYIVFTASICVIPVTNCITIMPIIKKAANSMKITPNKYKPPTVVLLKIM